MSADGAIGRIRGPTFEWLEPRYLFSSTLDVVIADAALVDVDRFDSAIIDAAWITFDAAQDTTGDVIARTQALARQRGESVRSITILSHGEAGAFQFGADRIDHETLQTNAEQWQALGSVLASDSAIYVFGCRTGAGAAGQRFVDDLAAVTGGDVYASDDLTGDGGDWVLEVASKGDVRGVTDRQQLPLDLTGLTDVGITLAYGDGVSTTEWDVQLDFDETAGVNAEDDSPFGNDNDGTVANASMWDAAGWLNGAVRLDGVNEDVTIVNSGDINSGTQTQRSISVWFNVDDKTINSRKQLIYEEGGGVRGLNIYVYDGSLYVGGWNTPGGESNWAGTWLSTAAISSGQWHNVTLTLDGGATVQPDVFKGYLDGVEFGSGGGSQLWSHTGGIGLGRINNDTVFHDSGTVGSGHAYAGLIDEFRLYNRVLSPAEVGLLANDPLTLATNTGVTVEEDNTVTITAAMLELTDPDTAASDLEYTLVADVANGTLRRGAAVLGVGSSFTQEDIDNSLITYEHDGSETVADSFQFTATDGGGWDIGATTFSITVNPVNDAPVVAVNTGLTLDEGATQTLTAAMLQLTDVDNVAADLAFTITTDASNGTLRRGAAVLGVGSTFTQEDIDNSLITYEHDGGETVADSFIFTATDGSGGNIGATTFSIAVNPINDDPLVTTNTGLTVDEALTATVTAAMLELTDADNPAADLQLTLTTDVTNGILRRGAAVLGVGSTFTQEDINNSLITYEHDGSETVADSFQFTAVDGVGGSVGVTTFSITVTPVNDPLVLTTNTGVTLDEGATQTLTAAMLQLTDVDNVAADLAFTISTDVSNGTLRRGGAVLGVGSTFTQEDIDNSLITYEHDGGETVADSFIFTATDGSGGNIGATTFSIAVNLINDPPAATTNVGLTIDEGATATITPAMLEVTDPEQPATSVVLTLTQDVVNGTLRRAGAALGVGSTFTQADINAGLITYEHNGGETLADSLGFTATDGVGGNLGNTVFSITVNPVNDLPTGGGEHYETPDETTLAVGAPGILANDSDVEGDPLTVVLISSTRYGTLVLNPDGSFTYEVPLCLALTDTFTYYVDDGSSLTGPYTVTIYVDGVSYEAFEPTVQTFEEVFEWTGAPVPEPAPADSPTVRQALRVEPQCLDSCSRIALDGFGYASIRAQVEQSDAAEPDTDSSDDQRSTDAPEHSNASQPDEKRGLRAFTAERRLDGEPRFARSTDQPPAEAVEAQDILAYEPPRGYTASDLAVRIGATAATLSLGAAVLSRTMRPIAGDRERREDEAA